VRFFPLSRRSPPQPACSGKGRSIFSRAEVFLSAGILDGASGKVGTLEIPLTVPKQLARPAGPPGGKGAP
jgi:hypothetical protein